MARRVGNDEMALLGREEAVRDVDGYALFPFGREPVDQQCEIELPASGPDLLRIGGKRRTITAAGRVAGCLSSRLTGGQSGRGQPG